MTRILILGTKYTMLLGVLPSAALLSLAFPFCRLWLESTLGSDYRTAALVMMGWAAADLLTFAAGTQWAVLLGKKHLRFLLWTQLPGAVLNILASIYIVGFTPLGIPGVLAATILIGFVRRPLLIWHTARQCGVPTSVYLRKSYLMPGLIFVALLLCGIGLQRLIPATSPVGLGLNCLALGVLWVACLWTLALSPEERKLALSQFHRQS